MRTGSWTIALLLCAAAADATAGPDENKLPANPSEALERAMPLIDAARKAKAAETPEIVKGIKRAVDWMQPHVRKGSDDKSWATIWNESLTLTRFHGNKPTGEYVLEDDTLYRGKITYGLPVGRGWRFQPGQAGPNVQSIGEIQRVVGESTVAAAIRVSVYSFNTVYSGQDGANAAGLAEIFFDVHRESMVKLESRSPQVTAKQLSRAFPRANYFEMVGTSKEEKNRVRIRAWFAKTSTNTFEFDAIEYRGQEEGDLPVAVWQRNTSDPELDAVLASIGEGGDKKK